MEGLISGVNVFVATQRYAIIKKLIKKSKKIILQKVILIYNRNKIHIDEKGVARDTILYKCNCLFNVAALTKDNVWVLRVQEVGHNHKSIFLGAHFTHKKTAMTQEV